ncbi:MAG: Thrombospondin 3-like protein [Parcubacteria group bacterium Gr01-1014_29]|nr:MAG: Thrombospondin 3-like protein [Parcubacteria group bacterium Gr01-1014_29]
MKRISIYIVLQIILFGGVVVSIAAQGFPSAEEVFRAYRKQKDIGVIPSIKVPTVVEVPLEEYQERWEFAVYDVSDRKFESNMYRAEPVRDPIILTASTKEPRTTVGFPERMVDKNNTTYTDILLPNQGQGFASFTITTNRPLSSSGITLSLEKNVALPTSMEIRAVVDGETRVVLRENKMMQNTAHFPQVTSSQWTIAFSYGQPLRITELHILDDKAPVLKRGVRFLAQPGHVYQLYLDPDNLIRPVTAQSANLSLDEGVIRLSPVLSKANLLYRPADVDEDDVPDMIDNCVSVANQDQIDIDGNARGDACDDFDRDGVLNSKDNCSNSPNSDQRDTDGDSIGDVCDKEESRFTEKYPWIPWIGIGSAGVVLIVLLFLTARSLPQKNDPGGD